MLRRVLSTFLIVAACKAPAPPASPACPPPAPAPAPTPASTTQAPVAATPAAPEAPDSERPVSKEAVADAKAKLVAKLGEGQRALIERGVNQVAALWRASDGAHVRDLA